MVNLSWPQSLAIGSNTNLGVAVNEFCSCNSIPSSIDFNNGDHPG